MRIGLKGAFGQSQITLGDDATIAELLVAISEATSLPEFDVKSGFPPQIIEFAPYDPTTPLKITDLKLNGQRLQVDAKYDSSKETLSNTSGHQGSSTSQTESPRKTQPSAPAKTCSTDSPAPLNLQRKSTNVEKDPAELPLRNGESTLIQRVMPDDNSCLFRAISKCVLGNDLDGMTELRSMVAQGIQADTERYNSIVLEKEPDEYCKWIQKGTSWGGAIEIGIIAEQFGIEVCAVNVQDGSVQRFNEGQTTRSYLVYSGIHWDAIVENPAGKWGPVEFDTTQFSSFDDEVLEKAKEIGSILNKAGYYTDTKKFGIKCNVCGWKGNGEQAAIDHVQDTTHMDFEQID